MVEVPFRIATPRLLMSRWEPSDSKSLSTALSTGLAHLQPWLPWAENEPLSMDSRKVLLQRFQDDFTTGKDYLFSIKSAADQRVIGGVGLHPRRNRAHEIGYWLASTALDKGFATEAAAGIVRIAFEVVRLFVVEIRCDPQNERSRAVPIRLDFRLEQELHDSGGKATLEVWRLERSTYELSRAKAFSCTAWDSIGRVIHLPA